MRTILWDCDDTLNNFRFDWFLKNKSLGRIKPETKYNDFVTSNYYQILNNDKVTFIQSLFEMKQRYFNEITVNKEIYNWFYEYGYKFNHIMLTAVSKELFIYSVRFVNYYFGEWIKSYNYVSTDVSTGPTKAQFIEKYFKDVYIFIDDSEFNCKQVSKLGIQTYCPKQPWNKGMDIKNILKEIENNE